MPTNPPPDQTPETSRVSLEAVASEAGVSLATASRALRGQRVRPHLQERVENAARRLGYRPDLAAQAVARGATKTVALIVDYLRSPFGVEITRGVVDAASRHELLVNVTGSETHPGDLLEMIASVRTLRPQSLVLATGRVQDPDIRDPLITTLRAYQASGGSVAIVDGADLPFASCSFDEVTAAHSLGRALAELGYARPMVFNSSMERVDLSGRTQALIDGLKLAGFSPDAIRLAELPTSVSSTIADDQLLELDDTDVVLCVEGAVLPAVYRHIRSHSLRVGTDVAVTAFGQYGIADALRPHLTTVMLPLRRAGELALEHALTDTEGAHLSLPGNLRLRASTPPRLIDQQSPSPSDETKLRPPNKGSVGVLVPPLSPGYTGDLAHELFGLADAGGKRCVLLRAGADDDQPVRLESLAEYDGLMMWGGISPDFLKHVAEAAIPCVVVGMQTAAAVPQLTVEIEEGMQQLLEHLDALGHKSLVYLAGNDGELFESQRRRGIDLFSATHRDVTVVSAPLENTAVLDELLKDGVTGVIAHDDLQGARIVQHLEAQGLRVPKDVSVAGFGGGWAGELSHPRLTTVHVDVAAAARGAWRLLDVGIASGEFRSLHAPLEVRGSTGAAPHEVVAESEVSATDVIRN